MVEAGFGVLAGPWECSFGVGEYRAFCAAVVIRAAKQTGTGHWHDQRAADPGRHATSPVILVNSRDLTAVPRLLADGHETTRAAAKLRLPCACDLRARTAS